MRSRLDAPELFEREVHIGPGDKSIMLQVRYPGEQPLQIAKFYVALNEAGDMEPASPKGIKGEEEGSKKPARKISSDSEPEDGPATEPRGSPGVADKMIRKAVNELFED